MKIIKTNSWKFYNPSFEYEQMYNDLGGPWSGHKYFGYDLVRNFQPKKVVELGTHLGCSLFSFGQAVKDGKLSTELDAIDTWQGDEHAGAYGEIIFTRINEIRDAFYSKVKINFIRTTFDKAALNYEDNSIDILHIDGLHTYKAVKHDFDTWFRKVKKDGIIILHDIVERENGFEVYKLWNELKKKFGTLEFGHSHGLGIIFKDQAMFRELKSKQSLFEMYYSLVFEREEQRWRAKEAEKFVKKYEKFVNLVKSSPVYYLWRFYKVLRKI